MNKNDQNPSAENTKFKELETGVNTTHLSKEELVKLLLSNTVPRGQDGLDNLVKEYIEKNKIKLFTGEEYSVYMTVKSVKSSSQLSVQFPTDVLELTETMKDVRPVPVSMVRNHFNEWVAKEKSAGVIAFVNEASTAAFGWAMKRAGAESLRRNTGIAYIVQIPGVIITRKKRKSGS